MTPLEKLATRLANERNGSALADIERLFGRR